MLARLPPIFFMLLSMLVTPLWAESATPVPQTLAQAEAQSRKAEDMRREAQRRFEEEDAACYQKILVNPCREDARKRHTQAIIEARQLEIPAREFQREHRRGEVEEEKSRRTAEAPAREAERQEQSERYRDEQAEKAVGLEQKRRNKETRAEENRAKQAEEQAKRQLKEERRAQRQAERIEKTAKKRAQSEQKAAAKEKREKEKEDSAARENCRESTVLMDGQGRFAADKRNSRENDHADGCGTVGEKFP
ncbi:MAG: hypothetical protein LBU43_00290 [Candidatus Accumulibacter sp.]|jgi:colicin import membrane protein|nr:hypothetical protein [Accumulibacter sp.]